MRFTRSGRWAPPPSASPTPPPPPPSDDDGAINPLAPNASRHPLPHTAAPSLTSDALPTSLPPDATDEDEDDDDDDDDDDIGGDDEDAKFTDIGGDDEDAKFTAA